MPGVVLITMTSLKKVTQQLFPIALVFVISAPLVAEEVSLRLLNSSGEPIQGAVFELFSGSAESPTRRPANETQIDQLDKEFIPTVTAIVAGESVSFPNSDDILHHVYSFSPAKTFDTPLYGRDANREYSELFDVPGVVEIGCNIHDWMLAYIYIGESELMAVSDGSGIATLEDIAPGEYTLKVWHSRLDAPQNFLEQTLVVEAGRSVEMEMTLDLMRDRRVRRAPSANRKRYR